MTDEDEWAALSTAVRAMGAAGDVTTTLESAVAGALHVVKHAEHAGISLVHADRRVETPAATDAVARRGDELQYELSEGPCLQSIREQETVLSRDLLDEQRWPRWSRQVGEELGIRSMLCFQLFVTHDTLGALNLYSTEPDAFDGDDRASGLGLAAHIAVALSAAQDTAAEHGSALGAVVIGQAQGILMQQYELRPSQAFLVLAREAERRDTTLLAVARRLADNVVRRQGPSS